MAKADGALRANVSAFAGPKGGRDAVYALDLILVVWSHHKQPFEWNPVALASRLNDHFGRRDHTAKKLAAAKPRLAKYFIELPDGRWSPHPGFFSLAASDDRTGFG